MGVVDRFRILVSSMVDSNFHLSFERKAILLRSV